MRLLSAVLGAALLGGCTPPHPSTGREPWAAPVDVRIAVVVRGGRVERVEALAADAAFRAQVDVETGTPDLWLLGYRASELRHEYPGLPTDPAALAARLLPVVDEGVGQPAPPADAVLRAPLERGPLTYETQDWERWGAAIARAGRLRFPTLGSELQCAAASITRTSVPGGFAVVGLGLPRPDATIVATSTAPRGALQFFRLERHADWIPLPAGDERAPLPVPRARLTWDRASRTVSGVDAREQLFTLDLEGQRGPNPPPPDPAAWPLSTPRAGEVARTVEGRLFATYVTYYDETRRAATTNPYTLSAAGWDFVSSRGAPLSPAYSVYLRARSAGRVLFYRGCWLVAPRDAEELEWIAAGYDLGCGPTTGRLITLRDADIDDDLAIGVGLNGNVISTVARSPSTGWVVDRFGADEFLRVAAIGGGRALLVTAEGALSVYRDRDVCPLPTGAGPGEPTAIAADPDLGVALVALRHPDGTHEVLRIGIHE